MSEDITETDDFVHMETDDGGVLTMLKGGEAFLQQQYYLDWGVFEFDEVTVGEEVDEWVFLNQSVRVDVESQHTQADVVVDGEVAYREVADEDGFITINTDAEGVGEYEICVNGETVDSFTVADVQEFDKETVPDNVKTAVINSLSDEFNINKLASSRVRDAYFNDENIPQHLKTQINDILILEPSKTNVVNF